MASDRFPHLLPNPQNYRSFLRTDIGGFSDDADGVYGGVWLLSGFGVFDRDYCAVFYTVCEFEVEVWGKAFEDSLSIPYDMVYLGSDRTHTAYFYPLQLRKHAKHQRRLEKPNRTKFQKSPPHLPHHAHDQVCSNQKAFRVPPIRSLETDA